MSERALPARLTQRSDRLVLCGHAQPHKGGRADTRSAATRAHQDPNWQGGLPRPLHGLLAVRLDPEPNVGETPFPRRVATVSDRSASLLGITAPSSPPGVAVGLPGETGRCKGSRLHWRISTGIALSCGDVASERTVRLRAPARRTWRDTACMTDSMDDGLSDSIELVGAMWGSWGSRAARMNGRLVTRPRYCCRAAGSSAPAPHRR